ncbi:MAG: DUF1326 domain-containing protein [Actinomycetota bacterium]
MAYKIKGTYLGSCSCLQICPCNVDGPPTGPEGVCRGVVVFRIAEGDLNELDLSGVDFAFYVYLPSNFSAGGVILETVVDEGASAAQAGAVHRIVRGDEGGPFAEMAALFAEVRGPERAQVTFTDGDTPSASVVGRTEIRFEPHLGPDGSPTVMRNALFGFAQEMKIGKSSGRSNDATRTSFEPVYGEMGDYEYSSQA